MRISFIANLQVADDGDQDLPIQVVPTTIDIRFQRNGIGIIFPLIGQSAKASDIGCRPGDYSDPYAGLLNRATGGSLVEDSHPGSASYTPLSYHLDLLLTPSGSPGIFFLFLRQHWRQYRTCPNLVSMGAVFSKRVAITWLEALFPPPPHVGKPNALCYARRPCIGYIVVRHDIQYSAQLNEPLFGIGTPNIRSFVTSGCSSRA
ncbi:hypothetical protein GJ744_001077 [Endocarpon pusillum]|uniref:Uncharacterized protein n=1 Tax=Endocarpon pusillum TaxID=364733 RepID=A0A8H7A9W9_9EURO|nr:hypothetical protein GJ744_001077 [Endocarpon pusillum]